jgi:hypothetical protein
MQIANLGKQFFIYRIQQLLSLLAAILPALQSESSRLISPRLFRVAVGISLTVPSATLIDQSAKLRIRSWCDMIRIVYHISCHLFESFRQPLHAPKIYPARSFKERRVRVRAKDRCSAYPLDLSSDKVALISGPDNPSAQTRRKMICTDQLTQFPLRLFPNSSRTLSALQAGSC